MIDALELSVGSVTIGISCANAFFEVGNCTLSPWLPRLAPVMSMYWARTSLMVLASSSHGLCLALPCRGRGSGLHQCGTLVAMVAGLGSAIYVGLGEIGGALTCHHAAAFTSAATQPQVTDSGWSGGLRYASTALGLAQVAAVVGYLAGLSRLLCRWHLPAPRRSVGAALPAKVSDASAGPPGCRQANVTAKSNAAVAQARPADRTGPPPARAPLTPQPMARPPPALEPAAAPPPPAAAQALLSAVAAVAHDPLASEKASKDAPSLRRLWELMEQHAQAGSPGELQDAYAQLGPAAAAAAAEGWQRVLQRRARKPTGRLAHACRGGWAALLDGLFITCREGLQ